MSVTPTMPIDRRPLFLALKVGQRSLHVTALALVTAVAGLSGAGLAVLEQLAHGTSAIAAAIAAVGLLVCGVVGVRLLKAETPGRLEVDNDGSARWTPMPSGRSTVPRHRLVASSTDGRPTSPVGHGVDVSARPFLPSAWFSFAGIFWLTGQCDGRIVRVVLGRDRLTEGESLRLKRWLRWLDRGGHSPT